MNWLKNLKTKNLISLSVGLAFLTLSFTGLMLYFLPHTPTTSLTHTIFGFTFLLAAIFHIRNNWISLKTYSVDKNQLQTHQRIRFELLLSGAVVIFFLLGSTSHLKPFEWIDEVGNEIRTGQDQETSEKNFTYERIQTNAKGSGVDILFDVRKGKYYQYPQLAMWLEDTTGHYLQTLYVSKGLAEQQFEWKAWYNNEGQVEAERSAEARTSRYRPEALPVWAHKFGSKNEKGVYVPTAKNPVPDAYSGATPRENFELYARTDKPLNGVYKVYLEINHSFDWNEYYTRTRYPMDTVYSGPGFVGQPSLVYEATLDTQQPDRLYRMKPIGHGHHSGQDGKIYPDLSELTTALHLIERIIVEVVPRD